MISSSCRAEINRLRLGISTSNFEINGEPLEFLPQMQAKRQEYVTQDHGPPAWKIPYTLMLAGKA